MSVERGSLAKSDMIEYNSEAAENAGNCQVIDYLTAI